MTMLIQFPAASVPPAVLLCEIDHSELILSDVNTRENVVARTLILTDSSGTETKSIIVSAASPDSAKFRAMSARVLRLVTLRVPKAHMPHAHVPSYLLAYVTETLECGHTLDFFPVADPLIARRRNCPQCADVSQKKPVQSVRFPARNKEAA